MEETKQLRELLETIDKNPRLPDKERKEPLFLAAMDEGYIAFRLCGCTLPTVHVTKKGRAFLRADHI